MPLEPVVQCPICDGTSFSPLHTCKDYTSTQEMFHVKRCTQCGLAMTSPRPTFQDAARYYQSESYISHTSTARGPIDHIYLIIRRFSLQWKYDLVKRYLNGAPLMDFGAGTGNFLRVVKDHGHVVYGVEASAAARSKIDSTMTVAATLADLPDQAFDVITLWHVLEHVYPLRETLQGLKAKLNNNGTIFIAVPNMDSYDAQQYNEVWAAYDVPRHLWHFTKTSMSTLLAGEGLTIKEIVPMKLDAYYVCLLSERYKSNGKLSLLSMMRAGWTALRSNLRGSRQYNHSSLIFVVQK